MKDLEELGAVVKDFCIGQVASGETKIVENCSFPCIPIAKIPPYLKSKGFNWREYGYSKLPDLINNIEGLCILNRGVPYVYLQSGENDLEEQCTKEKSIKFNEPKEHEIRSAYRKLITKPEEWVSIDSLMKEVKWHGTPEAFIVRYKLLQFKPEGNLVRVHNIPKYEIVDDIYFDQKK